jgi:DMSO/TMAO reductase YedYZ heme-binding membrane subunit
MPKIMATLITAVVVLVAVLVLTKAGRDIDAATQRFMLYYAGVLALVGLTGSVLLGLVATDRIVMTPGHRVMAQAVHRAFSFGTLAFLIIHIVTEILAQRSHVIDAVVPFLSPYRTFYIGLGTIASDLIILLVVTSILRKRFTEHGKAWRWRAIHYASYVAFVFAVLHGLLGGRTAKPYVDWSYGFAIAVTALGLAVRFLAISLRPKESLHSSPSADRARAAGSSPLHAAALGLAQARLGSTIGGAVQVLPAGLGGQGAADSWTALPVPSRSPASGPLPALGPAPAYAGPSADAYHDLGFTPLGAPSGDHGPAGTRARPYVSADQSRSALGGAARQPLYEPGYDGPPRFQGAPRGHGDVPQDELSSYPYGPGGRGTQPAPHPEDYPDRSGSSPWATRPSMPEPAHPRAALPAPPRPGGRNSGPMPQLRTGSMAQPGTGPMPRPDTGPLPRASQGRPPRNGMGPGTGPMPRAGTGPMPRPDTGPVPRLGTGPMPRFDGRPDTGPLPRPDAGGMPSRPATGPMPRPGTGPNPRPMPRPDQPLPAGDLATGPRNGPPPRAPGRGSHRARPADPRYRDMPGPTGGDEWQ